MKAALLLVLPLSLAAQTKLTHNETIQRSFPSSSRSSNPLYPGSAPELL